MRNHALLRGIGLASIVLAAMACQQGVDPVPGSTGERNGQDIQDRLDALHGARVVDVDELGVPRFVTGELGRVGGDDSGLRAALSAIAPVFRASADELVLKRTDTDAQGDRHFRFVQVKDGLNVLGGELILHARDGLVFAANGSARADIEAPAGARLDVADALAAAWEGSASMQDIKIGEDAQLAYRAAGDRLDLVYLVEVRGVLQDGTPAVDTVLVNAVSGGIVDRIPHVHTAKNRKVYDANHTSSLPGTLRRSEGDPLYSDQTVNINYDWLGVVYDCYWNLFNRDSFNDNGAQLTSTVHYSNNYVNAFWNGSQMVYGDGDDVTATNLAHSMDVTAHELTHAVTDYTSDLVYSGESGGLNEAMSDIFGNVCEWYRDGQVVSANTWKVGEDIWTPATPGDALRYMDDPSLDGASLDYYPDYSSGVDVHYSSGIANLAFYLLSEGGTHPQGKTTTTVVGIGIAKAAQIFYKANASILTSSSSFAAAKTATEQAASQLGYSAADIASATAAWEAVGVGVPIPPPPTTALTNDVPINNISGSTGNKKYYTLDVPAGATDLVFSISGGTGDSDLYVQLGSAPTMSSYDCRPYLNGNVETCTISNIQEGTYYVMLHAYSSYSGVSLVGSYADGGSSSGGGGPTCAHDICSKGGRLDSACDPCVAAICDVAPTCCNKKWDASCVAAVSSVCGLTCN